MDEALATRPFQHSLVASDNIPTLIQHAGESASYRFVEFFTATIRNPNTRRAYLHSTRRFFHWCHQYHIELHQIDAVLISSYIEQLNQELSAPTVKQHLAAIRMLFDFLVTGHIVATNPAHSVRGPKHVVRMGKTPVLTAKETRVLLDSIDIHPIVGLRDRALIGVMVYSFARVGAVLKMNVQDYFPKGKRWWFRLHEKGGRYHEVPVHHKAEEYLDAYLKAIESTEQKKSPLFRTVNRNRNLTGERMYPQDVWRMLKRRSRRAELPENICCHTFRATGITTYLENGGSVEVAQQIAGHESPRTTKLYDRRNDEIALEEVERVRI